LAKFHYREETLPLFEAGGAELETTKADRLWTIRLSCEEFGLASQPWLACAKRVATAFQFTTFHQAST
jgi:hypothetical protein